MKFNCRTVLIKRIETSKNREGTDTIVGVKRRVYDINSAQSHCIEISLLKDILAYLGSLIFFFLFFCLGAFISLILIYFIMAAIFLDFFAIEKMPSLALGIIVWLGGILFGVIGARITFTNDILQKAVTERSLRDGISKEQIKAVLESSWDNFDPVEIDKERTHVQGMGEEKTCGGCGKLVHVLSTVGERCPHCGAKWGYQKKVNY